MRLLAAAILWIAATLPLVAGPLRDAESYAQVIDKINKAHVQNPETANEEELVQEIPRRAVSALARVLKAKPAEETSQALILCGEAALDLAAMDHFQRIRTRLLEIDPNSAATLGDALARPRFLVRSFGALEEGYLDEFANLTDAILEAYDEVFAFKEWSKVPGKKIRIRLHLEERITRPPHFAPQYPYHSEIDMPIINPKGFRSPTPGGKMMFYGLCHELGHLIAMWGDRHTMEDHHAWAHYTGVVIVEHMARQEKYRKILADRGDVRWRSLSLERKHPANQIDPSTENRAGVMALLIKLHDVAGPNRIGTALNHMGERNDGHRINHVRYYRFDDLKKALKAVVQDPEIRKAVEEVFP